MELSQARKIRLAITILLMLLFLIANIYAVRRMMYYGTELYLYGKLNVAYQIGGMPGLRLELEKAILRDNMPRERKVAEAFKQKLASINDPGKYLQNMVEDRNKKVNMYRSLRNIAFGVILAIILLRLALNPLIKIK